MAILLVFGACAERQEPTGTESSSNTIKTTADIRAVRRAYDGAPPVIPHIDFGVPCVACHKTGGTEVPQFGFVPDNPHEATVGMSAMSRCQQCHVFAHTQAVYAENSFRGLRQDLRRGERAHDLAPPVLPHPVFMRENCQACHAGPAAREEIRCTHPERARCLQCHVESSVDSAFARSVNGAASTIP